MKKVIAYASGTVVFIGSMLLGFPYIQNAGLSEVPTPIDQAVVRIELPEEHGSGVLVSPDVVYTAKHVVEKQNYETIKIIDSTGGIHRVVAVKLVNNDFAVVILDKPVVGIKPAKVSCKPVVTGDILRVVGYPLDFSRLVFEVTAVGYVNNDGMSEGAKLLATGVVLPGDSGGPVFNKDGEVVGVVSGEYIMGDATGTSQMDTDLNMFAPVTAIKEVCRG